MKKLITVIFILLFTQVNGQSIESNKLKNALIELKSDRNINNQKEYFELFPDSFESFLNMFGFKDGRGAPLYDGFEYVQALFALDSIPETQQMKKWINISINGYWDADAVNYFQNNLRPIVLKKTDLVYEQLKKSTDQEIESFFYFFFNEIHPQYETIPSEFKKLKKVDEKFYNHLLAGHKRALKDSGH
jgi:hypothetical protein